MFPLQVSSWYSKFIDSWALGALKTKETINCKEKDKSLKEWDLLRVNFCLKVSIFTLAFFYNTLKILSPNIQKPFNYLVIFAKTLHHTCLKEH